jgi:CubicO group peptidase (beta-lactamase class C family)
MNVVRNWIQNNKSLYYANSLKANFNLAIMIRIILFSFTLFLCFACSKNDTPIPTPSMYFPPIGSTWETVTRASLGWNESKIADLKTFLQTTNSRALIVLQNGKIVIEEYLGLQLISSTAFNQSSNWYWASAGKTLTSALVGIANAQGKINFDAKTSDYIGAGWTSLSLVQENKITVRHQLTMTTGLDDYSDPGSSGNKDCTDKACLIYKADPGTRWAYHNAPYTLLDGVIAAATGKSLNVYLSEHLLAKVGMDGLYIKTGDNNVFYSTPRSMARYGLLLLNKGVWNGTSIIPDSYFNLMKTTSQNFNLSYGYLTWLNGKASLMVPGSQFVFPTKLCTNAPDDMFAAMGKNGQLINVVPSKNLVVIRMGDVPDNSLVPLNFQNDLWGKLNAIIK